METGSLISIRKNVRDILIPSEEVKLHMFPMDYEEFRWALGDTATIRLLQGCFHGRTSMGDATNRKLMRDFGCICLSAVCRRLWPLILKPTIWKRWTV